LDVPFTYLTGREHLQLATRIYQLHPQAVSDLLDRFPGWACVCALDKEVKRYSHGMRQQLSVLLAVLHDPCLLLLDEASGGFDDDSLAQWTGYLRERASASRSLVFVEHRDEVAQRFPPAHPLVLHPFASAQAKDDKE
jgi:ABC-2 type transport system ATP-binding protein